MTTEQTTEAPALLAVPVKRSEWYRGRGHESSRLRRYQDGLMCCLGFACLAAGHTEHEILGHSFPYRMTIIKPVLEPLVLRENGGKGNSDICTAIGRTNDAENIDDAKREANLIELGVEAGIAFTFED
jgi:hypothetical protein